MAEIEKMEEGIYEEQELLQAHSPAEKEQMEVEDPETDDTERGRPSTPKWWRPPIPPETYKWEEMRRQRQKGGYPWTHLDKDEDIDADDYLDENLYEPVNPPPLYGNESYLSKDLQQQVPQADEPMIQIPPELDIITSEGLDGLDKPDRHDLGFDGDREWQNIPSEDEAAQGKSALSSRGRKAQPSRQARSPTPKSVGFSPETITHELQEETGDQEVPEQMDEELEPTPSEGSRPRSCSPHGRKLRPFDILKSKAVACAGKVKQRIKSAIPEPPKVAPGQLSKKRKRKKEKPEEEEGEHEVEEGEAIEAEAAEGKSETADDNAVKNDPESEEKGDDVVVSAEDQLSKQEADDEKKRKQEEERKQQQQEKEERERKKAEEKLAKEKAAEEAKKAKEEEKARIAEEKRKAKEEADRIAAEKKKEEEARKAAEKAKKEEEARIAGEKKKELEAKKAAEKAKKEEEARIAAEKKKEEEAKKAAEKAKKAEEARITAEAKKAEEEAKKAAEKAQREEEARLAAENKKEEDLLSECKPDDEVKAIENEEMQGADATAEAGGDDKPAPDEEQEEGMEVAQPQTSSGTTKRKYIRHRRQLPQLPNPITTLKNQVEEFKNKLKRSRTPPRRIVQRKHRRSRSADASRSPPRDPEDEPEEKETKEEGGETGEAAEATAVAEETKSIGAASQATSEGTAQAASTGTRGRSRKQQPAKEKLDKIGQSLKGLGAKSMDIASKASKEVGQKMKGAGKDLQKLGSKAMGEIKAKQDSAKSSRKASAATIEMDDEAEVEKEQTPPPQAPPPVITPPKRTFRFRRRGQSQDEADEEMEREDQEHFYENAATQNKLLGSGAKDWESPHDRAHSREVSEEPISGNISARDSPPGSSLASSTFAPQVRRTGVLEEIDSDEFFLRERGISEGEDEEEVNRLLVEELRQTFRPNLISNALEGFDMAQIEPPSRPDRAPRKPPRKDKEEQQEGVTSMYQTFPPERPKRKQPQGYVSKFMKEHEDEYDDEMGSNEEVRGSSDGMGEDLETEDGMEELKAKLSKIDDEEDISEQAEIEPTAQEEYEDDGRYEPVSDSPLKPSRQKRGKKPKRPPTPPSFYYNTIAGNEWLRELETTEGPAAPVRKRRDSGNSASVPCSDEGRESRQQEETKSMTDVEQQIIPETETIIFIDPTTETGDETIIVSAGPAPRFDDDGDYVDDAGYAIVQKDREAPTTIPRKKKKRAKDGSSPSGRNEQPFDPNRQFFSMPRPAHHVLVEIPPTRPSRTYSTLKPKRPARSKSGSRQSLDKRSPVPMRREGDESSRPSTAIGIGIMQGRPLPPPPRPQRHPTSLHDLDQTMIEQSIGICHYANFDDIEPHTIEETLSSAPRSHVMEVDIACQTDPVPEDEFIVGMLTTESLLEDGSRIITASSRLERLETRPEGQTPSSTAGDVSTSFQTPHQLQSQTQTASQSQSRTDQSVTSTTTAQTPSLAFPSRLRLEELEVDYLRVKDLHAEKIKVGNLHASQIEANSISASGSISATKVHAHFLQSDDVSCSKFSSDSADFPPPSSIPPPSFYQLSSSHSDKVETGSEQELCLKTEENEERENESACPLEIHDVDDSMQNLMGNVDSTNDLKSSHVAEKILDKQLNVAQDSPASDHSETKTKKDASVGTPATLPINVPTSQLNNLNQESSTRPAQPELIQVDRETDSRQTVTSTLASQDDDNESPVIEETVVRGSYTLPYSYMAATQPTPPSRTSSLKKSPRVLDRRSKSPSLPRDEPHVAFGHTSIAQGDVLSVKLSIPVERIPSPTGSGPSSPRTTLRTITPSTAPDSAGSSPDSVKKNVSQQQPQEKVSKLSTAPRPSTSSSPQPSTSSASSPPAALQQRDPPSDPEEGFISTSVRLGRSVLRFTMRSLQAMADYIDTAGSEDPSKAEQQRANMQVLLCLLLVLVVGLILATTRSGPYTAPRWEFLMPPPDI